MVRIDKSKGLAFTVDGVDFHRGLHSSGSYIALVDGEEIYLSGVLCRTSKLSLEGLARKKMAEVRLRREEPEYLYEAS